MVSSDIKTLIIDLHFRTPGEHNALDCFVQLRVAVLVNSPFSSGFGL